MSMEKMQSRAIIEKVSRGKLMNESSQGRGDGNEAPASAVAGIYPENKLHLSHNMFMSAFQ